MGRTHTLSEMGVYNGLKRVVGFYDKPHKQRQAMEKALKTVSKLCFRIFDSTPGDIEEVLHRLAAVKIQHAGLAGNALGLVHARELFELVTGEELDEHLDYPLQAGPSARVHQSPEVAASTPTVNVAEASSEDGSEPEDTMLVECVILHYSQSKRWLPHALLEGSELAAERESLKNAGFDPVLPCGAKIFVPPEIYLGVVRFLEWQWRQGQGQELKSSHIVVYAEWESKVRHVVDAARAAAKREERGSSKLKDRKQLSLMTTRGEVSDEATAGSAASVGRATDLVDDHVDDEDIFKALLTATKFTRTFVHIPIPSSMHSALSTLPNTV